MPLATSTVAFLPLLAPGQEAPPLALRGLDPLELVAGNEVEGDPALTYDRNGFRYAFVSEEHREEFHEDGGRFEIQLGGACARMGPLSGTGNPDLFAVHEGKIYVFASGACLESFKKDPARHVDPIEDPLGEGREADRKRGQELLARVLEGVGGAERVDALESLHIVREAKRPSAQGSVAWREELVYVFRPSASDGEMECWGDLGAKSAFCVLKRKTAWDDWVWSERLDDTLRAGPDTLKAGVAGKGLEVQHWAARHEFLLQMSRELLFLLALRHDPAGFDAWSEGSEVIGERTFEKLVVYWNGRRTTFHVDTAEGHVVRASWVGRVDTGPNGAVVVDFSDFGEVGGLTLPRARMVTFDGAPLAYLSGPLAVLDAKLAAQDDPPR